MAEAARQDMRLDEAYGEMLERLAADERSTVSDVLRRMIASAYEEQRRVRRREAALRIGAMEIEEMPDPDELARQIAAKYDFERIPRR
jgi:hypothetical protein